MVSVPFSHAEAYSLEQLINKAFGTDDNFSFSCLCNADELEKNPLFAAYAIFAKIHTRANHEKMDVFLANWGEAFRYPEEYETFDNAGYIKELESFLTGN